MVAFRETHIRVVRVPPGEAPQHIREHWVGLTLPLAAGESSAFEMETSGVLSGAQEDEPTIGYVVNIEDAVAILASKSPSAASWWRENASELFSSGGTLVFDQDVCEIVEPDR